jgi:hypothetical protein
VKLVGGLNYRYALRGDGQPVTENIPPGIQNKAIEALLSTVTPEVLAIPESIIKVIPPRPIGYSRHTEVFKIRTSLTFDPLAAAEAASELTFDLVLNPARASRLVQHHARDPEQPSLSSFLDRIILATFKSGSKKGYEGAIQITINEVFLNNLLSLALHTGASQQARSIAHLKIDQLNGWLIDRLKITGTEEVWRAHYLYALARIKKYLDNPDEYKEQTVFTPPPGQPIGVYDWNYCGQ